MVVGGSQCRLPDAERRVFADGDAPPKGRLGLVACITASFTQAPPEVVLPNTLSAVAYIRGWAPQAHRHNPGVGWGGGGRITHSE